MEMIDIDRCTAVSTEQELAEWLAEEGARLLEDRSDWTRSIAQALRNASRPLLPVKVKAPATATAPVAATAPVVDNVGDIDIDIDFDVEGAPWAGVPAPREFDGLPF